MLAALSAVQTNLFDYNLRSELMEAAMGTNAYQYEYDPIGNRKTASFNAVTNLYAANDLNQYLSVTSQEAEVTCYYDADGNLTNYNGRTLVWDAENRLVAVWPIHVMNDVKQLYFDYDYMSRRINKRVYTYMPYLTYRWELKDCAMVYDGWNPLKETITYMPGTNPLDKPDETNSYIWGLDLSGSLQGAGGVGGLLSMSVVSGLQSADYYPCYDANGNVTDYVDTNGNLVAHYQYDPYGNITHAEGPMAADMPYRFSTKYQDDETGLLYYGYRYYNPELGRWINRDPIEEIGGMNLYAMLFNNAIGSVDLHGLDNFDCKTKKWHGQVGGGLLMYLGVTYDYEEKECKCCKSDGSIGRYWERSTSGTMTLSAGAGFDVDVGDLDWGWLHLDLAFHFSISTIGVNHTFTHDMKKDECNNIDTGPGRVCWDPSLDMGVQSIGVGNENFGLFGSAYARFRGHYCIDISESGISLADVDGNITATVEAYLALAGTRYYMINERVHYP
ncbi:MAG: RHS repeat-associated core domain-containing protein [Kiritimatiellae bacterium]|nr:RHS repeat-associated core domain-containing protein [Kiritimatiellia bacterium]